MHGALWTFGWGLVLALVAPPALAAAPDPHAAPRVMFPLAPPTRVGTATVRVRVLSARTGEPLPGASIGFVLSTRGNPGEPFATARTDAAGLATFPAARPGVFTVCAQGLGHAQVCERDVGLVAGGTLSVDLRLPPGGTLLGTVRQRDGSPVAGVRLVARHIYPFLDMEVMTVEALTDAQGAFRLEGLTPGSYRVYPHAPQGQGESRFVNEVKAGEETRLDIGLAGFASLTAEVVWPKGKAPPTQVSVSAGEVALTRQKDGTYQGNLEAGTLTVSGYDTLGRQTSRKVKLSSGKPQRIKLPPLASPRRLPFIRPRLESEPTFFELAGHVLLADGTPVKGMRVSVEQPFSGRCGNVPRRFSHYRFEGSEFVVQPQSDRQKETVYAWLEDGRAGSVEVSGTPGQRVVGIITLAETGAVTGRLTAQREDEFPISIVIDNQWFGAWQFTEPDGSFFVGGLAPGAHVLTIRDQQLPFTVRARERTELGLVRLPVAP